MIVGREKNFVLSFSIARANCVVTLGNSVVPRVKAFAREEMPHCAYGDMVLVASRTSEANRTTILVPQPERIFPTFVEKKSKPAHFCSLGENE